MNNSRQNLVTQAEKIIESYSKKLKKEPRRKDFRLLSILGIVIISAVFIAFYLRKTL